MKKHITIQFSSSFESWFKEVSEGMFLVINVFINTFVSKQT